MMLECSVSSSSSPSSSKSAADSLIEELDYESLPSYVSPWIHVLAGAFAGIAEHCTMYPIDSLKTRMQLVVSNPGTSSPAASLSSKRLFSLAKNIIANDGLLRLWRGMPSVFLGAGPAHAIYFSVYEAVKKFGGLGEANGMKAAGNSPFITSFAGVCATIANEAFMNPFDTVKQRLQASNTASYTGMFHCFNRIVREEGVRALYISYPTTLLLSLPFQSLQFPIYESMRHYLNPSGVYDPTSHILAGSISGAVASAATTPLDVVKTVLQTKGLSKEPSIKDLKGMKEAICIIHKYYGIPGFCRGMTARVLTHTPSTAICWTTYEYFKHIISNHGRFNPHNE